MQLCLWILWLAVDINLGCLGRCHFDEHYAFLAGRMSYRIHFLSQLRTFFGTCFKLIETFLKVVSRLAYFFVNERKTCVSGDFYGEILWSILLEDLCLWQEGLMNIWRVQHNLSDDFVIWIILNTKLGVLDCFCQNTDIRMLIFAHFVFLQFLFDGCCRNLGLKIAEFEISRILRRRTSGIFLVIDITCEWNFTNCKISEDSYCVFFQNVLQVYQQMLVFILFQHDFDFSLLRYLNVIVRSHDCEWRIG